MSKSILTRGLLSKHCFPAILTHYLDANREVFGTTPWVKSNQYPKLMELEATLRQKGIDFMDYTYTIVRLYGKWSKQYHRGSVALNIFCGAKALERYEKLKAKVTVQLNPTDDGALLYDELQVARYYVDQRLHGNIIPFAQAAKELKPLLSSQWLDMYTTDIGRDSISDQALEILRQEYHVKYATDYVDLVAKCQQTH